MGQNESHFIAYCRLYCKDYPLYRGKIADPARDLRKEIGQSKFDRIAKALSYVPFFKAFEGYSQSYDVLGAMVKLRCPKNCKNGGGFPSCRIRQCCKKKEFEECWDWGEFENCEKLDFLETGHSEAHLKNSRKLKNKGVQEFPEGKKHWYTAK